MLAELDLNRFHHLAKGAVSDMIRLVNRHRRSMTELSERQYVHFLGARILGLGSWVAFEQKYFSPRGYKSTIADIFACEHPESGPEYLWVEVKYSGLTDTGRRGNSFGALGWRKDFDHLKAVDNRVDRAQNLCYWTWLYLFNTFQREIAREFGPRRSWSTALPLDQMAQIFHRADSNQLTLDRLLAQIHKVVERLGRQAHSSILPRISDEKVGDYSALLISARIK